MRVFLRAFEIDDYKKINIWRQDVQITEKMGGNKFYISSERDKRWVEKVIHEDHESLYLGICLIETGEMIGYIGIINIDLRNRNAQWGGIIIGEKNLWGKGIAVEAAQLAIDYLFNQLGLVRFYGYWLEGNDSSLKMAQKLGFKQEGTLRQAVYRDGSFMDLYLFSLIREDLELKISLPS